MDITVTSDILDWLTENKIFFSPTVRWNKDMIGRTISFDDNLELEPYLGFYGGVDKLVSMGAYSYSSSQFSRPNLKIGRYCSIAGSLTFQGGRHPWEYVTTHDISWRSSMVQVAEFLHDVGLDPFKSYPNFNKTVPSISDDVWIGQEVLINDGIHIPLGTVVASRSVVTKNFEPYSIIGGNPARLIRKRFSNEVIELLIESEWWMYKFSDFLDLPMNDPLSFAKLFLERKRELIQYNPQKAKLIDMVKESS